MRAPITVITASIPGREALLGLTLASVYAQTVEVDAHLVMAQSCTEGLIPPVHVSIQLNQLLKAVRSEWTMRLDDDNQLLPHHIETLLPYLADADVVYSWDSSGYLPHIDCNDWDTGRLCAEFDRCNWVDGSAVAIRTLMLKQVGGWPTDWAGGNHMDGSGRFVASDCSFEDWACWRSLAHAGARFHCVPEQTWLYGTGTDATGARYVRSSDGCPATHVDASGRYRGKS